MMRMIGFVGKASYRLGAASNSSDVGRQFHPAVMFTVLADVVRHDLDYRVVSVETWWFEGCRRVPCQRL